MDVSKYEETIIKLAILEDPRFQKIQEERRVNTIIQEARDKCADPEGSRSKHEWMTDLLGIQ